MQITNRISLCSGLVVNSLENAVGECKVIDFDYAANVLKMQLENKDVQGIQYQIVAVELEPNSKFLVTISKDNTVLGSAILIWEELGINQNSITFPVDYKQLLNDNEIDFKQASIYVEEKYHFNGSKTISKGGQDSASEVKSEKMQSPSKPDSGMKFDPAIQNETLPGFKRPNDMPRFDDEYETNDTPQIQTQYPGLSIQPNHRPGYGDKDLYPMGESHPNFGNPLAGPNFNDPNGSGGMIFDPSNLRNPQDTRNRGPGYIPGSKYDDPFGRPGNSQGPGSFGGGFGSGFI